MDTKLRSDIHEAVETIDAAIFTGEFFHLNPSARAVLFDHARRWTEALNRMEAEDAPRMVRYRDMEPGRFYLSQVLTGKVSRATTGEFYWHRVGTGTPQLIKPDLDFYVIIPDEEDI